MLPLKLDTLILCLHDMALNTPTGTLEEAAYWFDFNHFIPLFDVWAKSAHSSGVLVEVTSDDGFASDYTHLYPWSVSSNIELKCFIPTDFVGQPGRVTVAELREMHASGVVIGSHGAAHLNWRSSTYDERKQDIERGKKHLEDILGERVRIVAPPFGAVNRATYKELRQNEFNRVYLTGGGFAARHHWVQGRTSLQYEEHVVAQINALVKRTPDVRDLARQWVHQIKGQLRN